MLSPTTNVRPSGVITAPFGNVSGSPTGCDVPSGCYECEAYVTRRLTGLEVRAVAPHVRAALRSTTMSLHQPRVESRRSACITTTPSASRRRTVESRLETASIRPSGRNPTPAVRVSSPASRPTATRPSARSTPRASTRAPRPRACRPTTSGQRASAGTPGTRARRRRSRRRRAPPSSYSPSLIPGSGRGRARSRARTCAPRPSEGRGTGGPS